MDTTKQIASGLAAELARAGHTKGDLAEPLGLTRQTIYSRFAGDVPFTTDDLDRAAHYLNMTFIQLMLRLLPTKTETPALADGVSK